jgi:hypothetical protein
MVECLVDWRESQWALKSVDSMAVEKVERSDTMTAERKVVVWVVVRVD